MGAWAYDPRGRVVSETKAISGAGAFTTQYDYDGLDRVISTTYPTGEVVTQTYNAQGALENVRSTNAAQSFNQWYVSNLDYHANGSLALLQLGNGLDTTYTYFPLNFRLQRLQIGGAQAFSYGYDKVGNVLTLTTQITQPIASTEVMAFKYDALDRLTNAVAVTNGYTGTYGYNPIGNLITKTESGPPVLYTYGMTQPHAVRALTNGGQFAYDLNGNMTQRVEVSGTQRITSTQGWDAENRLTVVTNTAVTPNAISKFIYDGDGARVMQVQISGTQVITTAYAGSIEVQITATQRITKAYYSAGSQLIAMRIYTAPTSSVLYYLHSDHLGSTSLATEANGAVVPNSRQLYDAWGNVRVRGDLQTDIGYTGQREDVSINAMFYRARFYSPALGRFLSADTIVPSPNDPQSLNRFAYTLNNPIKYMDPSGHSVTCGEGPDMVGGCGDNSDTFIPGQTHALAEQKYYNHYRPCQKYGGEGCSGLATAVMNTVETIDKVTWGAIGWQGGGCGGGGLGMGGQGCVSISFLLNLRSGQVGFYFSASLGGRVGTPNGVQVSAGHGPIIAPGVSDLNTLLGPSEYQGVDGNVGIFGKAGFSAQRSQSLAKYDSNDDGIADTFRPTTDTKTGMPNATLTVNPSVGWNQIPTGIEASGQSGVSYSWGIVFTAYVGVQENLRR